MVGLSKWHQEDKFCLSCRERWDFVWCFNGQWSRAFAIRESRISNRGGALIFMTFLGREKKMRLYSLNHMTGKWSLRGESIPNYPANERLSTEISERSNETKECFFLFQYKYLSQTGIGLSWTVTEEFQVLYKNTDPSRHIEMNQQLTVCPASYISLFVFQTFPRSSLVVYKPIAHIFATLGELRQQEIKNPSIMKVLQRLPSGLKSKGRSRDPSVIFSLVYSSRCLLPVQSVPITAVWNTAHSQGLDTLHLPLPIALIAAVIYTRFYAAW